MKSLKYILIIFVFTQYLSYSQEVKLYDESNSPLVSSKLTSLAIDSMNNIYVGCNYIYKFHKSWTLFDSLKIDSISYSINDIEISPNGTIWISLSAYISQAKLVYYDSRLNIIDYKFGLYDPYDIFIENDTTVYFSLINQWPHQVGFDLIGLFRDDSVKTFFHPFLHDIATTDEDTLLVASAYGISVFEEYDPSTFTEDSLKITNPIGWIPLKLRKLNNDIFVFGERLSKYKNGLYFDYPKIDSVLSSDASFITSIAMEGKDILWIGTDKGKLIRFREVIEVFELSNHAIRDIAIDRYKNKWFISYDGCFVFNEDKIVQVEQDIKLPQMYSLSQNYPNPFNPSTKIKYSIPKSEKIQISLFDILGRKIMILVDEYKENGSYEIKVNAEHLSNGIYFYRLIAENYSETKKMVVLK